MTMRITAGAAGLCIFATGVSAGVTPGSYSLTTSATANVGEGPVNAMDSASEFFGTTATILNAQHSNPDFDSGMLVRSTATVSALADGWRVSGESYVRGGGSDTSTSGQSSVQFGAEFFVTAGNTLDIWGEIPDYGVEGAGSAPGSFSVLLRVLRNNTLAFQANFWEDDFPGPQEIFSTLENDGATYRIELSSGASGSTFNGPGGWNIESYIEYYIDVSVVPAPGGAIALLGGMGVLARRRR